jgi:hypothetical protein
MPNNATPPSLDKLSRAELDTMAKKLGITGAISLAQKDLILQIEKKKAAAVPAKKPKAEPDLKAPGKSEPVTKTKTTNEKPPVAVKTPAVPDKTPNPASKVTTPPPAKAPVSAVKPAKGEPKPEKAEPKPPKAEKKSPTKAAVPAIKPVVKDLLPEAVYIPQPKPEVVKVTPDRVTLIIRDAYWLQCDWHFQDRSHQQAEISLGMDWAGAKFILRLMDLTKADHGRTAGQIVKEVVLPAGATSWFLESGGPGKKLQADLGYKTLDGKYYSLGQTSAALVTPHPGQIRANQEQGGMTLDGATALAASLGSVALSGEAMGFLEERMKRSISSTPTSGAPAGMNNSKLQLHVEAEVHVTGTTAPNARVLVKGEPVRLKPEGTFFVKMKLNDGRLILPATAVSSDGREEKTVILALERHTRYIDPSDREMIVGEE